MFTAFLCYLHRVGVLVPDLRVVGCSRAQDLLDAILAELPTWGEVEKIDVHDDADHAIFSVTPTALAAH